MSRLALPSRPARGLRAIALAASAALACITGCASSAGQSTTTEPRGGEAAPMDDVFECRMEDGMQEERAREDSGGSPLETELDSAAAPAAPSVASDSAPSSQAEQRAEPLDVAHWYSVQGAGLGALGCALDATDCVTAAQLGDEICRLAERVCDMDDDDPRCEEARNRCARARARIAQRCGPTS